MSKSNNDIISQALNLNPLVTVDEFKPPVVVEKNSKEKVVEDFELARDNIKKVINVGQEALGQLSEIAERSQHPRSYEVLSTIMSTLLVANKDLLELQKTVREISHDNEHQKEKNITNNNLFVGTSEEALKLINKNVIGKTE